MSLRSRIALVATLLVLAAVLVNTLLQTWTARRAVLEQTRVGGESIAEVLARAIAYADVGPSSAGDDKFDRGEDLQRLVGELVGGFAGGVRCAAGC